MIVINKCDTLDLKYFIFCDYKYIHSYYKSEK